MGLNIHGHIHFLLFVYHLLTFGMTDPWSVKRSVGIHLGILHFNILSIILANSQYYQQHNGLKCIVTDIIIFIIYWTSAFKRSKLNTKCGRSPRFGRPSRSGDTGCWLNSLVAWRLQCIGARCTHIPSPWTGEWLGHLSPNKQAVWNNSGHAGKQLCHCL